MPINLSEAIATLLSGSELTWHAFGSHKSGSVHLDTPSKRRLFKFLLDQNSTQVVEGRETLFPGLIANWKNVSEDPGKLVTTTKHQAHSGAWRLYKVEASNFGGICNFNGQPFELVLNGENWCLEGQNGSGKTSLASAILWGLTGRKIREYEGPTEENGSRAPVFNSHGDEIGSWPPLATYPATAKELSQQVNVWVKLTFVNEKNEYAIAYRECVSPLGSSPSTSGSIDGRLSAAFPLIEAGILMPARLSKIKFGEGSQSLYDAVKLLTGLDQLAFIADGVANQLTHGGRKFLKYAKEQDLSGKEENFKKEIAEVAATIQKLGFEFPSSIALEAETTPDELIEIATKLSTEAEQHLAVLKSKIDAKSDTSSVEGRGKIQAAVERAKVLVDLNQEGIPLFAAWKALAVAGSDPECNNIQKTIGEIEAELAIAKQWHVKQIEDKKLRFKALAAQWYTSANPTCPLCESLLKAPNQVALATELETLKKEANKAERKISDVCATLEQQVNMLLPTAVRPHFDLLKTMKPRADFIKAISDRYVAQPPFSTVLTGFSKSIGLILKEKEGVLPEFAITSKGIVIDEKEIPAVVALKKKINECLAVYNLISWWGSNRTIFAAAIIEIVGKADKDGNFPELSANGQLSVLEKALIRALPYDQSAKRLINAAQTAKNWQVINTEQKMRLSIRDDLEPLKDLRALVEAETARSISDLSKRIEAILDSIHLKEQLAYEDTSLKKKSVYVYGSFYDWMKIDAGHVANTSWLRAILWAFILALREETVASIGADPFPLFVLDDPQTTFDPRNKRLWARELVNLTKTGKWPIQLFLTTHEREFYMYVTAVEKLACQQGVVTRRDDGVSTLAVLNGSILERKYLEAENANDDAKAKEYIRTARIYVETLLKIMMKAEGPNVKGSNIETLRDCIKEMRKKHVPPFNRSAFEKLLDSFEKNSKQMVILNGPPHSDDETLGVAQATEIRKYWTTELERKIHDAFQAYDAYSAHRGDSRLFVWEPTVVELPTGWKDKLDKIKIYQTGIAAAAKTDGRAGDGLISIEQWDVAKLKLVRFGNHEVYRLISSTLEPVATIGDLVITSNYSKIESRDLVVSALGKRLIARRYNTTDAHPDIVIFTGQSIDPSVTPSPIIAPAESHASKKIVGTIFNRLSVAPLQTENDDEIVQLSSGDSNLQVLDGARLFKVNGRSAEPIALDGQFIVTSEAVKLGKEVKKLDGSLVVAVDINGASYFKRLRFSGDSIIMLESLNPDGTTPSVLLSLDSEGVFPQLTDVLPVLGVLFELPGGD